MRVAAFITQLETKPGREWTSAEFAQVMAWWREPEQEKLVWYCTARFLGKEATQEDVEEVWLDFYLKIVPRARTSYRPVGVGFCTYLLDVCLKNHCRQISRRLERRSRREVAWTDDASIPVLLTLEQHTQQEGTDPLQHAEQQAFLSALNAALNDGAIRPAHRDAFLLRYVEQLSYSEIARTLGIPEGTAKAWVHRVTARIAAHLEVQGWGR
jgi:RNA polymerase sigma factor (sigma-70 family)